MDKSDLPPEEMVASVVNILTESVPADYLLKDEPLDVVADKINEGLGESDVDKEKVAEIVHRLSSTSSEEMMEVMNVILERVFSQRNWSDWNTLHSLTVYLFFIGIFFNDDYTFTAEYLFLFLFQA